MNYVFKGNKKQMDKCKHAFLKADGDFNVNINHLSLNKVSIFNKYELKVELVGDRDNLKRFHKRVNSNYQILNGNILGMLDYI